MRHGAFPKTDSKNKKTERKKNKRNLCLFLDAVVYVQNIYLPCGGKLLFVLK